MLPMTKATYTARATSVAFDETKNGDVFVTIGLEVKTGNDTEQIAWKGYFSPKARNRTLESLGHMGWKGRDLSELDGRPELLPTPIEIECEPEDYNGKISLKVRWINAIGGRRSAGTVSADRLKALSASFASAEGAKDDIPFAKVR